MAYGIGNRFPWGVQLRSSHYGMLRRPMNIGVRKPAMARSGIELGIARECILWDLLDYE